MEPSVSSSGLAVCFQLSFMGGGRDYTRGHKREEHKHRARAPPVAGEDETSLPQPVNLSVWVAGIARRLEAQIRGDWTLIPSLRIFWFRFSAVSSHLIAGTYK